MTASEGRMDMMSAALLAAALAFYLALRERRLVAAVLVGNTLAAASMLTHPNGVLAAVGVALLAVEFDRTRLTPRLVLLALVPYAVGLGAWGLYALQGPAQFAAQMHWTSTGRLTPLQHPVRAVMEEIARYVHFYAYGPPWSETRFAFRKDWIRDWALLVPFGYALGVVSNLAIRELRRRPGWRILLLLLIAGGFMLTFLDGHKRYYYVIYVVPMCAATLAMFGRWLWNRGSSGRWVSVLAVVAFLAANIGLIAQSLRANSYRASFAPAIRYLEASAPQDALIVGSAELAFGLGFDRALVDDYSLGYWHPKQQPLIVVMGRRYDERLNDPAESPAIRAHIRHRLERDYEQVYARGEYTIYRLRRG
jgi:hypothetical protein